MELRMNSQSGMQNMLKHVGMARACPIRFNGFLLSDIEFTGALHRMCSMGLAIN
jgi:hypothetical protein